MSLMRCGENFYCPNRAVRNILFSYKTCGKTLPSPLIDLFRYLQSNGGMQALLILWLTFYLIQL